MWTFNHFNLSCRVLLSVFLLCLSAHTPPVGLSFVTWSIHHPAVGSPNGIHPKIIQRRADVANVIISPLIALTSCSFLPSIPLNPFLPPPEPFPSKAHCPPRDVRERHSADPASVPRLADHAAKRVWANRSPSAKSGSETKRKWSGGPSRSTYPKP